ncbi:hypothetical protein Leryth_010960 [Lithospermum erythrorhizon]|nr:hypothetical protein Leryth_010960 [Lithospermum erythrorhizon]
MCMLKNGGLEALLWGNYDMAANVLSRLSTMMLLRLKLVSKGLNDLIADRTLARLQMIRTETVCGFFYQEMYLNNDVCASCVSYVPWGREDNQVCNNVLEFLPDRVTIQAACNGSMLMQ